MHAQHGGKKKRHRRSAKNLNAESLLPLPTSTHPSSSKPCALQPQCPSIVLHIKKWKSARPARVKKPILNVFALNSLLVSRKRRRRNKPKWLEFGPVGSNVNRPIPCKYGFYVYPQIKENKFNSFC